MKLCKLNQKATEDTVFFYHNFKIIFITGTHIEFSHHFVDEKEQLLNDNRDHSQGCPYGT